VKQEVFVRGHRLSSLGLLTTDEMVAISVVEGSFTTQKYKTFLSEEVISKYFVILFKLIDIS
jgi:hypothetical protein